MKHMPGPFTEEIFSLEETLKSEEQNTAAPGNPYISGLSGRIGGMKLVLNHPLYAAAPEMLEALEEIVRCWEFNKGKLDLDEIAIKELRNRIAKARG